MPSFLPSEKTRQPRYKTSPNPALLEQALSARRCQMPQMHLFERRDAQRCLEAGEVARVKDRGLSPAASERCSCGAGGGSQAEPCCRSDKLVLWSRALRRNGCVLRPGRS